MAKIENNDLPIKYNTKTEDKDIKTANEKLKQNFFFINFVSQIRYNRHKTKRDTYFKKK